MFESTENGEVAHSEDKEIGNMLIANTMNCLSKVSKKIIIKYVINIVYMKIS